MAKEISYSDLLDEFKGWYGFPTGIVGYERLLKALMEAGSITVAKGVIGSFVDKPLYDEVSRRPRCSTVSELRDRVAAIKSSRPKSRKKDCPECGGTGWMIVSQPTPSDLVHRLGYEATYQAARRCACVGAVAA